MDEMINRLLRCFVIIEIKTHKITHSDIGQLQMYVNYFDRVEKLPDENPTVGILLCTDKNDTVVKFSLPADNSQILTSKTSFTCLPRKICSWKSRMCWGWQKAVG